MDNPQTEPNADNARQWFMSQRLPGKWMKSLAHSDDSRRYSLALCESIGSEDASLAKKI
jgi:hypothetical protein